MWFVEDFPREGLVFRGLDSQSSLFLCVPSSLSRRCLAVGQESGEQSGSCRHRPGGGGGVAGEVRGGFALLPAVSAPSDDPFIVCISSCHLERSFVHSLTQQLFGSLL